MKEISRRYCIGQNSSLIKNNFEHTVNIFNRWGITLTGEPAKQKIELSNENAGYENFTVGDGISRHRFSRKPLERFDLRPAGGG